MEFDLKALRRNISDTTMMAATLDQIRVPRPVGRPSQRPDRVIADKGYQSRKHRAWPRERKIAATIPERNDQIGHRRKKPGRPIEVGDDQKERYKDSTSSSGAPTSLTHAA
ncbi:transposase [Microbacterium sp. NPDC058345]|uniref:transposase n=1 Tax=Microbacterium sp. NPDC058345 TaxID=3346455 RepID=UPI00364D6B78